MSQIFDWNKNALNWSVFALIVLFLGEGVNPSTLIAQEQPAESADESAANPGESPSLNPPPGYTELTPEELAQRQKEAEEAAEAACAICGGGVVTIIFLAIAVIALNVFLLIWVARDAKSRGMDSSVLWMFLVMFTGLIGLIIYIFSRPQGDLVQCSSCNGKRLSASAKCPHCQNP